MKKLIFAILFTASASAFADQYDSSRLLTCTGMEEFGMSSIEIFDYNNDSLQGRIGMHPGRNFTFAYITQDDENKYFIRTEVGQFFLVKSSSGKWNLAEAYADQNAFVEVECK